MHVTVTVSGVRNNLFTISGNFPTFRGSVVSSAIGQFNKINETRAVATVLLLWSTRVFLLDIVRVGPVGSATIGCTQ